MVESTSVNPEDNRRGSAYFEQLLTKALQAVAQNMLSQPCDISITAPSRVVTVTCDRSAGIKLRPKELQSHMDRSLRDKKSKLDKLAAYKRARDGGTRVFKVGFRFHIPQSRKHAHDASGRG